MNYEEPFEGYTEEDMRVMEIEEIFAAYDPAKRERLNVEIITAIDCGDGTDSQKAQAKGFLEAAFSNVLNDTGIEKVKWVDDRLEIETRLEKISGVVISPPTFN